MNNYCFLRGIRITIFSLLIFLFFSCEHDKSGAYQKEFLVIKDSISIPLPTTVQIPEDLPSWNYLGDKIAIAGPNMGGYMNINIWNLAKRTWLSVPLQFEGPNQVYSEGNFAFLNDSLFYFFPYIKPTILTLNLEGKTIANVAISRDNSAANYLMNKNPSVGIIGTKVGFDLSEYYSLSEAETFYKSKLYGILDTATNRLTKIINYPQEFQGKTWSSNSVGRNSFMLHDTIYFNFVKSRFIYLYSLSGELIKKAAINLPNIKEMPSRKDNAMQNMIDFEGAGYYPKLVYDKWRDLFYRFAVYYDTNEQIKTIADFSRLAKHRILAIIVFDKQMNVLGVNRFPLNRGVSENFYFVNKQGLYLYSLKGTKEDRLNFYQLTPNTR